MRLRGPLLAGLLGVVLIVLIVLGLVLPKAGEVRTKQTEVEAAEQQEEALRNDLRQLEATAAEAPRVRRRFAALEAQVPPTADLPGLLRLLNTIARESAVDFMNVSPGSPASAGSVSAISTNVTVAGGFFALDQFLFRLERATRAARILTITVGPGPGGPPQLQITLTVEFYTTDTSSGPGSVPGPTEGAAGSFVPPEPPEATPAPTPAPAVTPTPTGTGASPSPTGAITLSPTPEG